MIADIRHPKLNMDRTILHSESATRKECVQKNEKKTETMNKSANVTFTGGFFSPKNKDSVNFSGTPTPPKRGFWHWVGKREGVQKFIKGKTFENILKKANDFAQFESLFMCIIAVTIKPLTIMALPAKEEDKKYAATKAFLGGVVDYAISTAVIVPITKIINAFNKKLVDPSESLPDKVSYLKEKTKFNNFKKISEYTPKLLLLPIRSALTIALIPPTLKYLFPDEAKKLKQKEKNKYSFKKVAPEAKVDSQKAAKGGSK